METPKAILDFFNTPLNPLGLHSDWVKVPELHLEVYMRISKRFIAGEKVSTVDVANLGVKRNFRRRGNASSLYRIIEREADQRGLFVFVENSVHAYMQNHHRRNGYTQVGETEICCFYRTPNELEPDVYCPEFP